MARGKACAHCGYSMYVVSEKEEAEGTWVTYMCHNANCSYREKVFESNHSEDG
ncbi:MAG: hypothetical protein SVW57_03500 [Thermodesulfobacteriota bacterium]|nr:hypothetical protein [Thermodesulfobacteriota bacterium]